MTCPSITPPARRPRSLWQGQQCARAQPSSLLLPPDKCFCLFAFFVCRLSALGGSEASNPRRAGFTRHRWDLSTRPVFTGPLQACLRPLSKHRGTNSRRGEIEPSLFLTSVTPASDLQPEPAAGNVSVEEFWGPQGPRWSRRTGATFVGGGGRKENKKEMATLHISMQK